MEIEGEQKGEPEKDIQLERKRQGEREGVNLPPPARRDHTPPPRPRAAISVTGATMEPPPLGLRDIPLFSSLPPFLFTPSTPSLSPFHFWSLCVCSCAASFLLFSRIVPGTRILLYLFVPFVSILFLLFIVLLNTGCWCDGPAHSWGQENGLAWLMFILLQLFKFFCSFFLFCMCTRM